MTTPCGSFDATQLLASADPTHLVAHDHVGGGALWVHLIPLIVVVMAFAAFMGRIAREKHRSSAERTSPSDESMEANRWLVVGLLMVTGVGHLPLVSAHLQGAPYTGILFIGFSSAVLVVAVLITIRSSFLEYAVAVGLCASGVVAYVATRLVAFPQLGDDVGAWFEPPACSAF